MSLNWITKADSPARLTLESEQWCGAHRAICFGLAIIGISEITLENVPAVVARFNLIEKLDGPILVGIDDNGKTVEGFTAEIVSRFVGLSVNVTDETEAKWAARITKRYLAERANLVRAHRLAEERREALAAFDAEFPA